MWDLGGRDQEGTFYLKKFTAYVIYNNVIFKNVERTIKFQYQGIGN